MCRREQSKRHVENALGRPSRRIFDTKEPSPVRFRVAILLVSPGTNISQRRVEILGGKVEVRVPYA